jgi:hypothetical protein
VQKSRRRADDIMNAKSFGDQAFNFMEDQALRIRSMQHLIALSFSQN